MRFKDRISTNQNRRKLKIVSQSANEMIVDVERADTNVTEAGTPLSANVLNDWDSTVSRVNGYIGKVTRTATVVVGLEASGYTADQVDILIPSGTADCSTYITQAINRLPSIGGEVKLLEGEYLSTTAFSISKDNVCLSGCGSGTTWKQVAPAELNLYGKNITLFNMRIISTPHSVSSVCITLRSGASNTKLSSISFEYDKTATHHGSIWISENSNATCSITGCSNNRIIGMTATNWRNIYVDGVAEYVAQNVLNWFMVPNIPKGAVLANFSISEGDEVNIETLFNVIGWATVVKWYKKIYGRESGTLFTISDVLPASSTDSFSNKNIGCIVTLTNNQLVANVGAVTTAPASESRIGIGKIILRRYSK